MLSQFQKQFIRSLVVRDDFGHFCLAEAGDTADQQIEFQEQNMTRPGPIVVLVCAPNLQAHRVGQRRVISSHFPNSA